MCCNLNLKLEVELDLDSTRTPKPKNSIKDRSQHKTSAIVVLSTNGSENLKHCVQKTITINKKTNEDLVKWQFTYTTAKNQNTSRGKTALNCENARACNTTQMAIKSGK